MGSSWSTREARVALPPQAVGSVGGNGPLFNLMAPQAWDGGLHSSTQAGLQAVRTLKIGPDERRLDSAEQADSPAGTRSVRGLISYSLRRC
jgi:hypothetical protein